MSMHVYSCNVRYLFIRNIAMTCLNKSIICGGKVISMFYDVMIWPNKETQISHSFSLTFESRFQALCKNLVWVRERRFCWVKHEQRLYIFVDFVTKIVRKQCQYDYLLTACTRSTIVVNNSFKTLHAMGRIVLRIQHGWIWFFNNQYITWKF